MGRSPAESQSLHNLLLRRAQALSPEAFAELARTLSLVTLEPGTMLGESGMPTAYAYFINSGVASIVASTTAGEMLEVAIVGTEGVVPLTALMGGRRAQFMSTVQLPGTAWRMPAEAFWREIGRCAPLNELVLSYGQHLALQLGQSALCTRYHSPTQRLARWLLITAEHAQSDRLVLTHEFLADMIGASRSSVSEAAAALRKAATIDYQRGRVWLRDTSALRDAACDCFDVLSASLRDFRRSIERRPENAIPTAQRSGADSASYLPP